MAAFTITLIYFAVVFWFGLRLNCKNGSRREFWVSAVFLGAAFIMLTLASFNIYTPSPFLAVKRLINMIFHLE